MGGEAANGKPLLGAVQFYIHHSHQALPEKRVSELYEQFLEQQQKNGRSIRYLQDIRSRLKRFADAFKMNIGEVQTSAIEAWLEDLEVSARTHLNFRTLLITFFKFARRKKYLPKDRLTAADELETPTTDDEDIEIYSHAELQRLINKSDEHTLPILCFGAFAGLRTAEIERLTWECVLEDQIEIRARTTKTRSRRLVPILPPLAKALASIRKPSGLVVDHIKLQYRMRELADAADDHKLAARRHPARHQDRRCAAVRPRGVALITCMIKRGRRDAELPQFLSHRCPEPWEEHLFFERIGTMAARSLPAADRTEALRQTLRRIGQGERLHRFMPWVHARGESPSEMPAARSQASIHPC